MTSACLSQTSKTHVHHSTLEKSKAFQMLKMCRLSRVYILAKGALGCATRVLLQKENPHARLPRTRTKSPLTIFFSLACQFVPRRVSQRHLRLTISTFLIFALFTYLLCMGYYWFLLQLRW
mgnify:FL=1